jgi:hypothetical protein
MHEEVAATCSARGAEVVGWSAALARGGGRPTVPPRHRRARVGARGTGHAIVGRRRWPSGLGPKYASGCTVQWVGPGKSFPKIKVFPNCIQ